VRAVAHHGDPIRQGEDLLETVRDEQNGRAAFLEGAGHGKEPSTSTPLSAAVGSSMMRTRALRLMALAIFHDLLVGD
jgi:hypothetical protein